MNSGIYALYWQEPDLVYIGQSIDINRRFKEHRGYLGSNTHCNYKVQNTYSKYGMPEFTVLEYCTEELLNSLEVIWTKEFDSLNPLVGLNLIEPGSVSGRGTNHSSSKYTKEQILKCFKYLYTTNPIKSYKEISCITGINIATVATIKNGNAHIWLKDKYPNSYHKMENMSRAAINKYKDTPIKIVSAHGVIVEITNISNFAKDNGLDHSALNRVILGKVKTHKGWKLYK